MKSSMKMGVIALIGLFVVFYQYHLSTSIRFDQIADFNTGGSAEESPVLSQEEVERYVRTSKFKEVMVNLQIIINVHRLRLPLLKCTCSLFVDQKRCA